MQTALKSMVSNHLEAGVPSTIPLPRRVPDQLAHLDPSIWHFGLKTRGI